MKEIMLTQGKITLVDDDDYPLLSTVHWSATEYSRNLWYATTNKHPRYMHKRLLQGGIVDHIDGDGLNNQRHNLRVVGHQQNIQRSRSHVGNTPYKGVWYDKRRDKYQAYITKDYHRLSLGSFDDPVIAAEHYDLAAVELFGEFARCNFGTNS